MYSVNNKCFDVSGQTNPATVAAPGDETSTAQLQPSLTVYTLFRY